MNRLSTKLLYFVCSVLVWIGVSIVSTACSAWLYQPKVPSELLKK
ncbi:cyclic lactone autoinducer peptide [Paenibacillus oenotherae]|uniref:Cyclic lactone autoinducer peptide n=1 Tax=Paenibacillus oenotherae TaxID=1435645 RepID=A0ABS7DD55_9BACL|nr:cyclic lactone autoinducer peptide [Paenibacillus oenotherae]